MIAIKETSDAYPATITYQTCTLRGCKRGFQVCFWLRVVPMKEKPRSLATQGSWLQSWHFGLSTGDSLHFTMLENLCLFRVVIPNLITRVQSRKCAKEDRKCSDKQGK